MRVYLFFLLSVLLLIVGHLFRLARWEQFIRIYERPSHGYLLSAMAGGYAINFFLPFHTGDLFRAVFCGRKMRNGVGFGISTVLMDRFLDVWIVTLFFVGFRLSGLGADPASERYYLRFSAVLLVVMFLVILLRNPLKRFCLFLSGIFNDTIKLDVMTFLWSLINTFRNLARVQIGRLLVNTVLMWGAYLASYASAAACLTRAGTLTAAFDIFRLLFGGQEILQTTLAAVRTYTGKAELLLLAWLVVPLAAIFALTFLPRSVKDRIADAAGTDRGGEYENLLPQLDPNDRSIFLSRYFGLENREYLAKFLEINRNINIIQDYSAGSNATTMLCMDGNGTFFRKYAFGDDGKKLAEQLAWIKRYEDLLPLCAVLRDNTEESCCWYDMDYSPSAVDFFRFIHSHPIQDSSAVLNRILNVLQESLYSGKAEAARTDSAEKDGATIRPDGEKQPDMTALGAYIERKVLANLEKITESRALKELLSYDTLVINGISCKNLPAFKDLFRKENLLQIFADDPVAPIHGDLTIENIICCLNSPGDWYLIDPNGGNIHDSPYLDYAKLLQSLHGSYEFLMMTPRCRVEENRIDFQLTRSAAYDALHTELHDSFAARYGSSGLRSIYMHELVHWLRLLPYKLSKDRKRAPMFYAGFILAANDYLKEFENT